MSRTTGAALPLVPAHEERLPPARVAPGGVLVRSGVPYAALPGARPLELDLWLPPAETAAPAPVVVFLHGGGWRLGSRHRLGPAFAEYSPTPFERVAQAGLAVAAIDYRLSGEAPWPAQLHDAKAAVRWLRARADALGIDAERVAAWGESAGGHLAALLGLTHDDPVLEGEVGITGFPSHVCSVVAWYPPTDLLAIADDLGVDPLTAHTREAELLGAAPCTVASLARQASPVAQVTPAAPPFLLLHGAADRFVPPAQSERLNSALREAGVDVELRLYEDADHMWLGSDPAARQALERTVAFLRHHLTATDPRS
ncbi:alpha/beta hydrolase fold domain-containing protein [Streptomyces sp. enrichment culture]|uniref:alpha/beta hydrolase fold domain-containing protein n=1 Tax=Streptomyces sp. enrichment culture TaxID=1795815 RepID=UPI003F568137